jgi:hypothetical protein
MAAKTTPSLDLGGLISELMDIGTVDTVYRDLYVRRARSLLAGVFSIEELRQVEMSQLELATLPVSIARALQRGDWPLVKKLSSRAEAVRAVVESKRHWIDIARGVYVDTEIKLDPFSPGLLRFTRVAAQALPALQARTVERLTSLERADQRWQEFYSARRRAFQQRSLGISARATLGTASMDPRQAAHQALQAGNMSELARLADTLMAAPALAAERPPRPASKDVPGGASERAASDLLTTFSEATIKGARRLGLAPRRLPSMAEVASLRQYAWEPIFDDEPGLVKVKQVPLPAGTPEAFRDRLEMLMIHPLVNSGGARHLPRLVAEDVLIEDFADPKEGEDVPASELLAILGLAHRRGVARVAIEQALVSHGADVLDKELRLDPRVFRLVCIPPDVHLRLGQREQWGRQPFWTHFDGYIVMANGRLRALAGGDVRHGGLYDLLGVGPDYDSDRLMGRFAVVRRERMVGW